MKKIKVLEIVPNMQQGGLENLIMNIFRNIDKSKYEVHFLYHYTASYYFDEEIVKLGGIIHKCSFREDANIIKYVHFLNEFFKRNKFDVIHSHMITTSRFTLKYAKKYGVNILINHIHISAFEKNLKGLIKRVMIASGSKYANVFLACSEEAGKLAYKNKEFTIINNCIDLKKYEYSTENRDNIRSKLKINRNDIVFGNIGRLNIQKNQLFLLEAFSKVKLPNVKLIIIGFGELKNKIEKKIIELNLIDKVTLLENVDTSMYYNAMDCFVLPSISEGFPLTAVEAQANGCPCIFSKNITEKTKINENVKFLENDIEEWSKAFSNFNMKRVRQLSSEIYDYDIKRLMNTINSIYQGKSI